MKEQITRDNLLEVAKLLNQKNYLAAADGNISYFISEKEIWITPSGRSKSTLKPSELAVIDIDGKTIQGTPSSEKEMHLEIYRNSPEARAVVHAHPPTAIAWTIAFPEDRFLPAHSMSELIIACGSLPIIPYARPGTKEMGTSLREFLPNQKVFILARHGALAWGTNLEEAVNGIERIEHSAEVLLRAKQFGQITSLPETEIQALHEIRKKQNGRSL